MTPERLSRFGAALFIVALAQALVLFFSLVPAVYVAGVDTAALLVVALYALQRAGSAARANR
jgi:hypothetical protein